MCVCRGLHVCISTGSHCVCVVWLVFIVLHGRDINTQSQCDGSRRKRVTRCWRQRRVGKRAEEGQVGRMHRERRAGTRGGMNSAELGGTPAVCVAGGQVALLGDYPMAEFSR